MNLSDLVAIELLQAEAYGDYFRESADVIAQRFYTSPDTAWVAERDDVVCAYLVGYLSRVGKISPLNAPFTPDVESNCLYLHDLALLKSAQGFGLAKQLIHIATQYALHHVVTALALLSVQHSKTFWQSIGFSEFNKLDAIQKKNLESYLMGEDAAFYMVKML
jgi:GNAT superfamily N-acetyltransferase